MFSSQLSEIVLMRGRYYPSGVEKLLTLGGPIASLRAPMNLLAGAFQFVRVVVFD